MFRRIALILLIVCMFSLFLYQNVSYADFGEILTEKDKLRNREKEVYRSEKNYDAVYDVMTTLIGDYAANETAIKRGNAVTLIAFGGAAVSACVAVASGGSLAPAAYAAFVGAYNSSQTAQRHPRSADYLAAMEMTMTALDNAMYDMNAAYYGGFLSEYANGVVVDYQFPTVNSDLPKRAAKWSNRLSDDYFSTHL